MYTNYPKALKIVTSLVDISILCCPTLKKIYRIQCLYEPLSTQLTDIHIMKESKNVSVHKCTEHTFGGRGGQ